MKTEKYVDPFSESSIELALQFDKATLNKNPSELRKLIDQANTLIPNQNIASQAHLFYSIGTAYGGIAQIESNRDESLLKNQLYYFRKSILLIEQEEFDKEQYSPYVMGLKLNLYTNFGNTLDHCGRKIAAIGQYKKALLIHDNFGMALGNLGMAYRHYGMLVCDPVHRDYFHHFAYTLLNQAIESEDPNTHSEAKQYFSAALRSYDSEYVEKMLAVPLNITPYDYPDEDELTYRKWALDNNLFLNPLNDLPVYELCFAADVLHLPKMRVKIDDKLVFHGMFNQLKQEYIFARYQYYCGQQVNNKVHFADKDTYLLNFADYPQYSLRIEMIKSSFKTLYSLLDKVAFFMNYYFELGIKERDISFHSIWYTKKSGKYGYKYNNFLNPKMNFALASIYWISKDFYEELLDSPNPHAMRIREIRNSLEHKYVKITWGLFRERGSGEIDDLALYISEVELSNETLKLLKLIREVIICLALAVGIEEDNRSGKLSNSNVIAPTVTLMEYDDDWKI